MNTLRQARRHDKSENKIFTQTGIIAIMFGVLESWQSGNAPDSKSGEPAYTGAQVQILYSPFYKQYVIVQIILKSPINVDIITFIGDFLFLSFHMFKKSLHTYE